MTEPRFFLSFPVKALKAFGMWELEEIFSGFCTHIQFKQLNFWRQFQNVSELFSLRGEVYYFLPNAMLHFNCLLYVDNLASLRRLSLVLSAF